MQAFLLSLALCFLSLSLSAQSTFIQNKVIAHRGAWKKNELPQNSIASLREAIRLGCEGSEFDVWMTADEVLVINHDADFQGLDIEHETYETLLSKKTPKRRKNPNLGRIPKRGNEAKEDETDSGI